MFRSAALSFGPRLVGVVLAGMLNDGAAGLHAIKSRGGTAVVQHPIDAEADQIPLAALEATDVDHVAPADGLGPLITQLSGTAAGNVSPLPDDGLQLQVDIAGAACSEARSCSRSPYPAQ